MHSLMVLELLKINVYSSCLVPHNLQDLVWIYNNIPKLLILIGILPGGGLVSASSMCL